MEKYLLNKKEEIKELDVKKRMIEFPLMKNFIVSVIGPRRAGKTYSLFNLIISNGLKDEEFIFINFEDEDLNRFERKEIVKAVSYHRELYGKEPRFVFLDEVHALERWQRFVYSLFEKKKYFIFLTGSSSKLLSKEIATQLRGRTISTLVLPFSFKEILVLKNITQYSKISTKKEDEIKSVLRNYLRGGGFPDVVLTSVNKRLFFRDYIDLVVYRDVVERHHIKNPYTIKTLVSFMLPSFSKEFSINNIFNILKSRGVKVSKKVLYSYSYALGDAFFCFFLKKFSHSERETHLSIPKIYFNDLGLINYSLLTKSYEDYGRLMENAVYLELKRKESLGKFDALFHWKDYQQKEVDFVIKEGLIVKQLIQVTYASGMDEIEKREIKALIKASKLLNCKDLLAITWDYEGEEKWDGKKIKFAPLWKWLLQP
ncbi:MAG: ATP-binding protein [Candidatus Aenigmarchaeota archaeon]|nr:ATP-binding protein [Candidatus Aenigmarchaeota archaeon]